MVSTSNPVLAGGKQKEANHLAGCLIFEINLHACLVNLGVLGCACASVQISGRIHLAAAYLSVPQLADDMGLSHITEMPPRRLQLCLPTPLRVL